MKLWRGLVQRQCPNCNQKLLPKLTMVQQIARRNLRQRRLVELFGRTPRRQTCRKCGRVVFEGETGYQWDPLLLMDWDAREKVTASAS